MRAASTRLRTSSSQATYHLNLVPSMWKLTKRKDSRVFQGMTAVEIMRLDPADGQVMRCEQAKGGGFFVSCRLVKILK